ncbi:MAG: hypothetical protein HGB04_03860 [Chlorobiaceae bacterium]|nr:hypothetical protein [Chlorobiaceae bacterium]
MKITRMFGIVIIFFALFVTIARSAVAEDVVYTYSMSKESEVMRIKKNAIFEASITPLWNKAYKKGGFLGLGITETGGTDGCNSFVLMVKNNSDKDITIVWDKTLFIDNSQTRGTFMFEGVRYIERDAPKPSDLVLSGGSLSKEIYPNILVYYVSGQYGGWRHKPMRDGYYGVYLAAVVDGKPINEKLMIKIQKEVLPSAETKKNDEARQ